MAEKDADVQKIQELIKIMKENDLVEIDIKHGDDQIALRRAQPPQPNAVAAPIIASLPGAVPAAGAPTDPTAAGLASASAVQDEFLEITSPIVGTFYEAPSPDSDPYVEIGTHVNAQTVVCIIEAMKVMNEIKAEVSGTIVEMCVTNGQAIEYGQALFKIQPD
jgi:acetyl-CoA carboxylase biotin carboxyl carrier protein